MADQPDFRSLCSGGLLRHIEICPIPAPPHAEFQGLHLIINCLYDESLAALHPERVLEQARADTLLILQASAQKLWLREYRSLAIRFYLPRNLERTGWALKGKARLYAYSILIEGLDVEPGKLDLNYMLTGRYSQESSEVEAIAMLL